VELIKLPFEDYFVSKCGNVFSEKKGQGGRYKSAHLVKSHLDKRGYLQVTLYVPQRKRFAVHRLVAMAKYGELIPDIVTRHKDGNAQNNSWENILVGSQEENIKDRDNLGNTAKGEKHYRARYSDAFCLNILNELKSGKTNREIEVKYNLLPSFVSSLKNKRIRKHLQTR
jgi:hypothetical protein